VLILSSLLFVRPQSPTQYPTQGRSEPKHLSVPTTSCIRSDRVTKYMDVSASSLVSRRAHCFHHFPLFSCPCGWMVVFGCRLTRAALALCALSLALARAIPSRPYVLVWKNGCGYGCCAALSNAVPQESMTNTNIQQQLNTARPNQTLVSNPGMTSSKHTVPRGQKGTAGHLPPPHPSIYILFPSLSPSVTPALTCPKICPSQPHFNRTHLYPARKFSTSTQKGYKHYDTHTCVKNSSAEQVFKCHISKAILS
ncbi:hypothetical protein PO909_006934, partial [Leuciscus waleckii]